MPIVVVSEHYNYLLLPTVMVTVQGYKSILTLNFKMPDASIVIVSSFSSLNKEQTNPSFAAQLKTLWSYNKPLKRLRLTKFSQISEIIWRF